MRDTASLTVAAHTLGCKVNQCDTEALLARLSKAGFLIHGFSQPADIYIINTCTVTHVGDKKSLQMVRRARKQNPTAFIAVCGCMPRGQHDSADKAAKAGADFIFDTRKPEELLAKLSEVFPMFMAVQNEINAGQRRDSLRTRMFIKIQDGCNRYCTYCIVPYVRGPLVSRPFADIMSEATTHIRNGAHEIVITGIQVAAYGYDTGSEFITLPGLIKQLDGIGIKRLRLSSIDPWAVDDAFLTVVRDAPALCDHFHLSLQSGSNKTLAGMNRNYTTADYTVAAKKLKRLRPDMALTTDIIVGFPGESDEDFKESLQFASNMGFSRIHVFEYSPRAGTPAADFPAQIPSHVKAARGEEMRTLAKKLEQRFMRTQIGKQMQVLFETKMRESLNPTCPDIWQGYTENYCIVKVQGANLANSLKYVKITDISDDGLIGELC